MTQVPYSFAQALRITALVLGCTALVACDAVKTAAVDDPPEPGVLEPTRNGPAGAPEGSCWGKTVSPAVVEQVRERIQIKPAKINPDGTIAKPPVYKNKDRQVIITPRQDNWFETPCADVLTPELISSLQRALQARGDYAGPITGMMDPATRAAITRMQTANGLASSVLSLETARLLGLVAVPRSPEE